MERQRVISILESLANGVDPATGAAIVHDAFHESDAVRALFTAATLLKEGGRGTNPKFVSAGTAWSADEDARLGQEFDSGMSVAQMALQHGRTSGAITSRLVKIGRVDVAAVQSRDRGARVAS